MFSCPRKYHPELSDVPCPLATPTLPTRSFACQVADRLQAAVDKALDQGYRTKDIWKEGTQLVKCSEMGEILLKNMAA